MGFAGGVGGPLREKNQAILARTELEPTQRSSILFAVCLACPLVQWCKSCFVLQQVSVVKAVRCKRFLGVNGLCCQESSGGKTVSFKRLLL